VTSPLSPRNGNTSPGGRSRRATAPLRCNSTPPLFQVHGGRPHSLLPAAHMARRDLPLRGGQNHPRQRQRPQSAVPLPRTRRPHAIRLIAVVKDEPLVGRGHAARRQNFVLKRSGDRGWGTTVKWLSGLSLCVCVRTCFVGCLSKAPLFPSRALLK